MKKIKVILVLLIIILIMIIINIVCILNRTNNENNTNIYGEPGEEINFDVTEVETVKEKVDFFTVESCINYYLDIININNTSYYGYDENNNIVKVIDDKTINSYIYNLLSNNYINENSITINNVNNNIDKIEEKVVFIPLEMNVLRKKDIERYIVYGILEDLDNNYIKDMYIIVNLDVNNKTFSIEPINKKYDSIDQIVLKENNEEIKENDNNVYNEVKISDEYMSKKYIDYFKKITLSNPELSYKYLDKNYRERRFGSLKNFVEYIEENKEEIVGIRCEKYLVEHYNTYSEYVIQDQYENLYIFNVPNIMDFSLKLDTYTLESDKFKETYSSANNEYRTQMNIDKFFKMINRHDYNQAYNCLAQSFIKETIKNEESFIEIVNKKLFKYNNVEFLKFEEVGNNVFVYKLKLTDLTGKISEAKEVSIIMQLKEGTDFEMSFNIK